MARLSTRGGDIGLRMAGLALLVAIGFVAMRMEAIGFGRAGHEPAIVYLLALLTFFGASIGVTLAVLGRRMLARVVVSDRWAPHVPAAFREEIAEPKQE